MYIRIDLCGTYNLVHIRENNEWKTTFTMCCGYFEYVVIPFGLTNAFVNVFHQLQVGDEWTSSFVNEKPMILIHGDVGWY